MGALKLIKEVEGTNVISITADNVFSDEFNTYIVNITFGYSSNSDNINARFINSSGSEISSSNYDTAHLDMNAYGSWSNVAGAVNNDRIKNIALSHSNNTSSGGATMWIFNPFQSGIISTTQSQSASYFNATFRSRKNITAYKNTQSVRGITFFGNLGGTFTTLSTRIYGLEGS